MIYCGGTIGGNLQQQTAGVCDCRAGGNDQHGGEGEKQVGGIEV